MWAISCSTSSAVPVGLAKQDRGGVEVVACARELLDRPRGGTVHRLKPRGNDAGGDHAATASPAFSTSSNEAMMTRAHCGLGSLSVTSVTTNSIPSEPTASASRS